MTGFPRYTQAPIFVRHVTATSPTVLSDTVGGLSLRTYGGEPLGSVDQGQPKVSSGKKAFYHPSMLLKVKKHIPSLLNFQLVVWIVLKNDMLYVQILRVGYSRSWIWTPGSPIKSTEYAKPNRMLFTTCSRVQCGDQIQTCIMSSEERC